jgi:predicted 3-demethylubiquinone-9 3-methyltransferase (glyoxalase superfamily)
MQKITTFLWFDSQAEEAARYYASIFTRSRVTNVARADGRVLLVNFELDGQRFIGLNGGPQFKFTEAISLYIDCESQAEVDELWEKLSAGGQKSQCGWLKDKYGLSWQVVPSALRKLMSDPNQKKANAVMQALLKMSKIEIAALQEVYDRA